MAGGNKSRFGTETPQTKHRRMTRMHIPGLDENPEIMSGEDEEFETMSGGAEVGKLSFEDFGAVGGGKEYMQLGLQFLNAAKRGDAKKMKELLSRGLPVNLIDPDDRAAALHYIAAYDARPALRVVMKSDKLDYLVRDREGRLPSELAREFGHDVARARLLA